MWREEADGVVAPVVRQSPLDEERLGHIVVDRQQFDRGDAETDEVVQRRLMREARVGAAQFFRHAGMPCGEPAYVHFVEDRVGQRVSRPRR